jgi:hypothetical protein
MLHTKERETVEFTPVNFNVKSAIVASAANLAHLQKQRTKANRKRKPAYQAKIDAHFGLK